MPSLSRTVKEIPNKEIRKEKKRKIKREKRKNEASLALSNIAFLPFLGKKKKKMHERSKRGRLSSVLEPSARSPSKQSKDREATGTRARARPMMEGGDECILSREKRVYATSATAGI